MEQLKRDEKQDFYLPIVEYFYSIQGEGYNCGKAAFFLRLAGCPVRCSWCDSKESWDVNNAQRIDVEEITRLAVEGGGKNVVITGGEPLMYNLDTLCNLLKNNGLDIWLETSGIAPVSGNFDWVCLSPKRQTPPTSAIYDMADELKIIVSGAEDFEWALSNAERVSMGCHLYLQPEWGHFEEVTPMILEFVKANPKWRISLQTHKFLNIR